MIPRDPPAVLTREATVTRPATLWGCTFAVLAPGELAAVLPFADPGSWHAVRLAADGRFISGTAWPGEAEAREWVREDMGRLLEAEEDHYRRTGTTPEPMTPILLDAPMIVVSDPVPDDGSRLTAVPGRSS